MSSEKRLVKTAKVDYKNQTLLLDGEELPFHISEDVHVSADQGTARISVDIIVSGEVEVIHRE